MKKPLSAYILLIPLLMLFHQVYSDDSISINPKDSLKTTRKDSISIVGVGDIMMGTNFPSTKYLHPKGCNYFFSQLDTFLIHSDITTGNLEGCLSDSAELVKRCKDTTKCYAFRMPTDYGDCLRKNGFDFLSIANNHSHDFGKEGVAHTTTVLDSMDIQYAGTSRHPYSIKEKGGIIYGFCAFSPNKGTLNITDYNKAMEVVEILNDTCDIVIVSFHGGAEGDEHQNVTRETETYYGENRGNVHKFSHLMVDAGADLVFGHGPHVSRAIELYNDRLICYSLGNFLTYGRFNLNGPNGIAPLVKAYVSQEGTFLNGKIIPVKQYYSGRLIVDPAKRAIKKIRKLTQTDFPESEIEITNDGIIRKK
jgi:poly-gamma-glutamate capsule biosynthesis protein CapA/YwtB (metallophosphatase superfamily)